MKKPLMLPKFKNEDEEFDFWSGLDLTEHFEPSDFKRVIFPNLKRTKIKRMVAIRLPEELIEEAKEKAQKLKVPYQKLMREILQHGISSMQV